MKYILRDQFFLSCFSFCLSVFSSLHPSFLPPPPTHCLSVLSLSPFSDPACIPLLLVASVGCVVDFVRLFCHFYYLHVFVCVCVFVCGVCVSLCVSLCVCVCVCVCACGVCGVGVGWMCVCVWCVVGVWVWCVGVCVCV